ncbi:ASKHA domain-containing protein [Thermodesulfovibrio sp. TK110]
MSKIRINRSESESNKDSLLQLLQKQGIYIPASCGGKGICGRCKIKVLEGSISSNSFLGISEADKTEGFVLACQSFPQSDILIELPAQLITVSERIALAKAELIENIFKTQPSLLSPLVRKLHLKIEPQESLADFENLKIAARRSLSISRKLASQLPDFLRENQWNITLALLEDEIIGFHSERLYGIAIDIGTTTVAMALIALEQGKIMDVVSCYNSQINYGDDVITRIVYAEENPHGLNVLRKCIVDDINALINTVSVRSREGKISCVILSGNTTMCHLFWGINPSYIRQEPYTPVFSHYPVWRASEAKLLLDDQIPVYTIPSVAGYVGGDIVAGVLASGLYKNEELSLFIDIGTNGEIVIGNKEFLVTASTSAGPCFEGSGISCGMRATEGAVESFKYYRESDSFEIKVIGNVKPQGICGSGMIDILAELFSNGVIDQKGKLLVEKSQHIFSEQLPCNDSNALQVIQSSKFKVQSSKFKDGEAKFIISSDCYITQSDIDNIIRAKAAIYAGISTLLQELGINEKELKKVYIAGGFGEFLDVKKAIKIGMLPNLAEERFIFLGNTSLTGAVLCLLSKHLWKEANEIAQKMTYIDLSRSKKFMDEYVSALFLPHTDWERFKELS